MELRPYQSQSIEMLFEWMKNNNGNVCVVLPTGSGKSHVIASLIKNAVQNYSDTRVLMLTHSKELISQNAEKMRQHWSNAPMGIYSASLNRRCLSEPITFAGIQSVSKKATQLGHIDLCIVDEAHSINHTQSGGYRLLISDLLKINPAMRVIGYSASPYRLGHGMIHEGDDVIFDDLIEPVSIEKLVADGYLSTLRSKHTALTYSTAGVKKSGGEFVAKDLELTVNTHDNNTAVITETIKRAEDRKSILVFCAGVAHAHDVANLFNQYGVIAACVTGDTNPAERDRIIRDFQAGKIRVLTNVNVLTTGFDYPAIDCIVFLRPTMSPGLYYQMAGRGLRIAEGKANCMVLDFAGNVSRHGPITAITPPKKRGNSTGDAPTKTCPECDEIVPAQVKVCPSCNHAFMPPEKEPLALRNDDIMGIEPIEMNVKLWSWRTHTSRTSGKEMLKVTYYGELSDPPITEYFPVLHEEFAGNNARQKVATIAVKAGTDYRLLTDLAASVANLQQGTPPASIKYRREGKYFKVERRIWAD
jgi:DNA repair protein RadD